MSDDLTAEVRAALYDKCRQVRQRLLNRAIVWVDLDDVAARVAAAIRQAALLPDFAYPRGSPRVSHGECIQRALRALRGEP